MAKWLEFSLQMYLTPKAIRETFLRNHQCWIVLVSMWNIHCKMINIFAVFFSVDDCDRCDIRAICVKGKCQCRVGYTGDGYQCTKSKFIIFKLIGSSCCNAGTQCFAANIFSSLLQTGLLVMLSFCCIVLLVNVEILSLKFISAGSPCHCMFYSVNFVFFV